MNNARTGFESGISFTEQERALLNELKKTDPVPKHESKRLQVLRETKLIGANDLEDVYVRFTRTISRLFKVRYKSYCRDLALTTNLMLAYTFHWIVFL
jgi:hypothetical protein